jgi:hypothetical protein
VSSALARRTFVIVNWGIRFGRPAGEKRVYVDLAKKPTGAANLRI